MRQRKLLFSPSQPAEFPVEDNGENSRDLKSKEQPGNREKEGEKKSPGSTEPLTVDTCSECFGWLVLIPDGQSNCEAD